VRVAFVYANPRALLLEEIAAGRAPDTGLLGQNHLMREGIEAVIHRPRLRRRDRRSGLLHRITWNAREVMVPWELEEADVACSPLVNLMPLAARVRGRPRTLVFNVSICTTYARRGRAGRRALAVSANAAERIVCFAGAQRERLLEQTGVPEDRVSTLLLGVDERFFSPASPPADGYVLAVGRDLARDYATFAESVQRLPVQAILVASPRNLTGVALPPNVEVRLDVGYPELRDLYAGAACIVIPTHGEEYATGADCSGQTALLDAMAMGRPVVVSARKTLREYITNGVSGLTVPPEDPTALQAAVEEVLADRDRAELLGAAGRKAIETRHTTRLFAAHLAEILRPLAD
jgi:glycosyltransferase involved in cell wall biosynthesis